MSSPRRRRISQINPHGPPVWDVAPPLGEVSKKVTLAEKCLPLSQVPRGVAVFRVSDAESGIESRCPGFLTAAMLSIQREADREHPLDREGGAGVEGPQSARRSPSQRPVRKLPADSGSLCTVPRAEVWSEDFLSVDCGASRTEVAGSAVPPRPSV
jgi:hypothetical protein